MNTTLWFRITIVISFIFGVVLIYYIINHPTMNEMIGFSIGIGIPFLVGSVMYVFDTSCPSCKKLFARKYDGKKVIKRGIAYEQIEDYKESTMYNDEGEEIGTIKTPVNRTVPFTAVKIMYHFHCKYCGHR
jgi:hypothetical protein